MVLFTESSRRYWVLAAMGGVLGLVVLDETVVGVALHTIRHDLGMSAIGSHWVVNAYFLVFAGFVAAGGKLGDIVDIRSLFSVGIAIFGLASLACGFAQDGTWLIVARGIQGIGAAIIFPASMAMMTIVFPEEQRGVAIGIYGSIGTIFLALGPLVGGYFTEALSWRWIFWINPPFVVAIAAVVWLAWVKPPRSEANPKFDRLGLLTMVGGLSLLVFGVMQGPDWGWSHPGVWLPLLGGAALLVVFVAIEHRLREPLIQVDLFRNGTVTSSNLMIFVGQLGKTAMFVFGALYFQAKLEMSPLEAGTALLAAVVPTALTAFFSGRAADRYGSRRPALAGVGLTAIALLWMGIAVAWTSYVLLLPALLLFGAVQALVFAPSLRAMMNAVPIDMQGQAGGIVQTAQILGGTIGMAVGSTLLVMTGDYGSVFLATGIIAAVVLVVGWFKMERD